MSAATPANRESGTQPVKKKGTEDTLIGMPVDELRRRLATIRAAVVNLYTYVDMVESGVCVDMLPHTNLVKAADSLALIEGAIGGER